MGQLTWEEAVEWYRAQPNNEFNVFVNYFDRDVVAAAKRFAASEEFHETLTNIPRSAKTLLEIGAGMGVASYAFAEKDFDVTALEPDPSDQVGTGAIKKVCSATGVKIQIITEFGESLPFPDEAFDVVYVRQVLHHARDLKQLCKEVSRVLRKGGVFISVREHVLKTKDDLQAFLDSHPLHHLYGGENAFTLEEYKCAIAEAGMTLKKVLAPYDSIINFFPETWEGVLRIGFVKWLNKKGIRRGGSMIWWFGGKFFVMRSEALQKSIKNSLREHYCPGNIYSFIGQK